MSNTLHTFDLPVMGGPKKIIIKTDIIIIIFTLAIQLCAGRPNTPRVKYKYLKGNCYVIFIHIDINTQRNIIVSQALSKQALISKHSPKKGSSLEKLETMTH